MTQYNKEKSNGTSLEAAGTICSGLQCGLCNSALLNELRPRVGEAEQSVKVKPRRWGLT